MSLGNELREALSHEAEMRSTPPPDVGRLISGGRARRRRRTVTRIGAVTATVLACTAVYAATTGDRSGTSSDLDIAITPSLSPQPMAGDRPELAAGSYRVLVGTGAAGKLIDADFTVQGPNWITADFWAVSDPAASTYAGFGVYMPEALADGTGCVEDRTISDLGRTPTKLAAQLARLPRSTVLQPPTPTQAFGRSATHLRLQIDVDCSRTYYRVAHAPGGTRGISFGGSIDERSKNVVIDFWVMDLGGVTPVVVDLWHNVDATTDLVDRATEARDSITFVAEP